MSDFSQRNMSLVPKPTIKWLVGRLHVGQSDAQVETYIREKLVKTCAKRTADACVRFALKCHRDNRKLYSFVMGGM